MKGVVDASILAAFLLPDEANEKVTRLFEKLAPDQMHSPMLLQLEVSNVLLIARRRERITLQELSRLSDAFDVLPIAFDPILPVNRRGRLLQLAEKHALTAYDAAYLELAMRFDIPLLSLDKALIRASKVEGVFTAI